MKTKLTVLSLSPLCLLTGIKNLKFTCQASNGKTLTVMRFLDENILILFLISGCLIWCIISAIFFLYFKFIVSFGKNGGYTISEMKENKEAGLEFFLTLILPLIIGDLNEWQNMISFLIYLIIIFILLMKTDWFYKNPILTILGYHVYEILFERNNDIRDKCIIISATSLEETDTIEYKTITPNILFVKKLKKE